MDSNLKKIDGNIQQGIVVDKDLNRFLTPEFPGELQRQKFIKQCLKRLTTRRMLLQAQWYVEIADYQSKVKDSRPALNIIFLMSMAEALVKLRLRSYKIGSLTAIKEFFGYILPEDKEFLKRNFRRALLHPKHHTLLFSSILRVLYDIRNKAVHGEDFFSFSLYNESEKEKYMKSDKHVDFSLLTWGALVSRKARTRRRVTLEVTLTYNELRDIFRRTAFENIKAVL